MSKHPAHGRHLRSVEIFQTFDAFKRLEKLKPSCRGGGMKITERSIKYSSENGCIGIILCTRPSRIHPTTLSVLYSPCCFFVEVLLSVIIKGKGCLVCTKMYVGFIFWGQDCLLCEIPPLGSCHSCVRL